MYRLNQLWIFGGLINSSMNLYSYIIEQSPQCVASDDRYNRKERTDHQVITQRDMNTEVGEDDQLSGKGDTVAYQYVNKRFD